MRTILGHPAVFILTLSNELANTDVDSFVFEFLSLSIKFGSVETSAPLSVATSTILALSADVGTLPPGQVELSLLAHVALVTSSPVTNHSH